MNPERSRNTPFTDTSLINSPESPGGRAAFGRVSSPRPSRLTNGSLRPAGSYEYAGGADPFESSGWICGWAAGLAGAAGVVGAGVVGAGAAGAAVAGGCGFGC